MKKTLITCMCAMGLSLGVYAQGTIFIDNLHNTGTNGGAGGVAFNPGSGTGNPSYSSQVTANGLIFTMDTVNTWGTAANGGPAGNQLLGTDVNFTLLGGATAQTATTVIASFTGAQIAGDNLNWGQLQGPTGAFNIPGSTASSPVFLDLQVWEGNAASYALSTSYKGDTGVFVNASGGGANAPAELSGMPDLLLTIPEPSTFALAGLGAAALMIFRRRK